MVTIETNYLNAKITIHTEEQSLKALMADAVSAVDYVVAREANGKYQPPQETPAKADAEPMHSKESVEKTESDAKPVQRKTYFRDSEGTLGIVEKGDVLPEGAVAMSKTSYEKALAEHDETDPGDGADEQAEEAGGPDAEPETAEDDSGEVSDDDLRNAIRAYMDDKGPKLAKELIKKHGGERVSEVPEENRAALYAEATKGIE